MYRKQKGGTEAAGMVTAQFAEQLATCDWPKVGCCDWLGFSYLLQEQVTVYIHIKLGYS